MIWEQSIMTLSNTMTAVEADTAKQLVPSKAEPGYPKASIIVVTWNQRELTLDCLNSLAALNYPAERLGIIVVDNGSSDGTTQAIRERFPQVTVLENAENLGFTGGNNVGICHALESGAEYIMLLNNDTVVASDMLQHLISVAETDPGIGIVTPTIYYYDEPTRIWCAGAGIDWRRVITWRLRAEEIDDGTPRPVQEVDFASGCAICVRRSVVERIGLLDPRFFIYFEETEWCMRISQAGYRCVLVPQSKVWHKVSSAMQQGSPRAAYYMTRNTLLFLHKSLPGMRAYSTISIAIARELVFITVMSLRPRHRHRRVERTARLYGILDFLRGRFGKMPENYVSST
jgi:GT2 family glycosyltransferase